MTKIGLHLPEVMRNAYDEMTPAEEWLVAQWLSQQDVPKIPLEVYYLFGFKKAPLEEDFGKTDCNVLTSLLADFFYQVKIFLLSPFLELDPLLVATQKKVFELRIKTVQSRDRKMYMTLESYYFRG